MNCKMVLEATVIIVDNSEWMRNGDYSPSRLQAQKDAVNLVFNAKQQSHPENSVGILSSAGKSPQMLVTLTSDRGKILNALHSISLQGKSHFLNGIQIAQLSLKHRQNKNQHQRIVCFVGSPVEEEEAELVKVAKKLKKNGVAVDIVNFGQEVENTAKLDSFISTLCSNNNSHLVTVPPGPHILSDVLVSSAIVSGPDGASGGAAGGSGGDFEFGVDPSLDPELALALRLSMEEERARQGGNGDSGAEPSSTAASTAAAAPVMMDTEDDELARAIAMSIQDSKPGDDDGKKEKSPKKKEKDILSVLHMNVPRFVVSLDEPYDQRYAHIASYKSERNKLPPFVDGILKARDHIFENLGSLGILATLMTLIMNPLLGYGSRGMYLDEVDGIVKNVNSEIEKFQNSCSNLSVCDKRISPLTRSEARIMQFAYEFYTLCTSVGLEDPFDNDTPVLIRTMDWPMDVLGPLTVQLEFTKNGTSLFHAATWFGFAGGVFTGMRSVDLLSNSSNEPYAISVNYRLSDGPRGFLHFVRQLISGKRQATGQIVRRILEEKADFGQAAASLKYASLVSTCYFTIVGSEPGHGLVITRGPDSCETRQSLRQKSTEPSTPIVHIIQTNTDHIDSGTFAPGSEDIFDSKGRVSSIKTSLTSISKKLYGKTFSPSEPKRKLTNNMLWGMMEQYPVSSQITIYGTLMKPKHGYMETRLPCRENRKSAPGHSIFSFTKCPKP